MCNPSQLRIEVQTVSYVYTCESKPSFPSGSISQRGEIHRSTALKPPTVVVGSLPIERLPKGNPGPGSRPAHTTGKPCMGISKAAPGEQTCTHYRETLRGHLKGCTHIGQEPFLFPTIPKAMQQPLSHHSTLKEPQCFQRCQTLKVFNDLPASSAGPKQLSMENNILINAVQTGV